MGSRSTREIKSSLGIDSETASETLIEEVHAPLLFFRIPLKTALLSVLSCSFLGFEPMFFLRRNDVHEAWDFTLQSHSFFIGNMGKPTKPVLNINAAIAASQP
jgi:hypothetical protein